MFSRVGRIQVFDAGSESAIGLGRWYAKSLYFNTFVCSGWIQGAHKDQFAELSVKRDLITTERKRKSEIGTWMSFDRVVVEEGTHVSRRAVASAKSYCRKCIELTVLTVQSGVGRVWAKWHNMGQRLSFYYVVESEMHEFEQAWSKYQVETGSGQALEDVKQQGEDVLQHPPRPLALTDQPAAAAAAAAAPEPVAAARAKRAQTAAPAPEPPAVPTKRPREESTVALVEKRSKSGSGSDGSGDGKLELAKLLSDSSKIKLRFSASRSACDSLLSTVETVRAWAYAKTNIGPLLAAKAALIEEYERRPFAAMFFATQSNMVRKRAKDVASLTVDLTGLQALVPLCDKLDTEIDILQQMHDARMKAMNSNSKAAKSAR